MLKPKRNAKHRYPNGKNTGSGHSFGPSQSSHQPSRRHPEHGQVTLGASRRKGPKFEPFLSFSQNLPARQKPMPIPTSLALIKPPGAPEKSFNSLRLRCTLFFFGPMGFCTVQPAFRLVNYIKCHIALQIVIATHVPPHETPNQPKL
jgi:hypothetical protein